MGFDRIYGEGERGYVECVSGYGGEFLGEMDKGDVDRIEGLSGGICIDEKRSSKNGG